jgi:hypothetical protein
VFVDRTKRAVRLRGHHKTVPSVCVDTKIRMRLLVRRQLAYGLGENDDVLVGHATPLE